MSTSVAAFTEADMALNFASPIVTFLVGPQKCRFNVHKNVLCQAPAGSFFQKVFGGGFNEPKQLPEDGPDEVQFFVNSLYGVWMGTSEAGQAGVSFNCEALEFSQQIKLYVFARRYGCRDLQNAIISDVIRLRGGSFWLDANIRREDLNCIDKHLPGTTPMHSLLSRWFIEDVIYDIDETIDVRIEGVKELPGFLLRAAVEHVIRSHRHLNCKTGPFDEQSFMVPGDTDKAE